jgi:nucleotide-binding universal stress UspA family protein
MRVLIALDGSDGSFEAVRQIAPLLTPARDELALYCRPPNVQIRSRSVAKEVVAGAQDSLAQAIFAEARKRLPSALAEKSATIVGHQDPRHGIIVAAQQWSAELIVMGARGLSPFQRLLLGSVSRAVVHAALVGVWIARPGSSSTQNPPRVLLATESPESAKRPAELLSRLTWPDGSAFTILTVIQSIFAGRVPDWLQQQARSPDVEAMVRAWAAEHDEEIRNNAARINDLIGRLPPPLQGAQALVAEGEAANVILSTAKRQHSDLIVVGTRQKWSIGNAILGSVSEAVLNHADCSVLVVPRQETP